MENAIRPVAVCRKNYLSADNQDATQRSAMFYYLLGTCKAYEISPPKWLSDLMCQMPSHPINRTRELMPQYSQG